MRDFYQFIIANIINGYNVLDLSIVRFSSKRNLTKEKRDTEFTGISHKKIYSY